MVHEGPLLGIDHEGGDGIASDGDVGEEPGEFRPGGDHGIDEGLTSDFLVVVGCIATADSEQKLVSLEDFHCLDDASVGPFAPAFIGCCFKSLNADGRVEVLHPEHFLGECLVDQGAVGEGQERAIGKSLAEFDDIMPTHQRLSAAEEIGIGSECSALLDD